MFCDKYNDFTKLVIYQIYPRSFMDSNGDGIGDLQGIISRLDHIQELGANAVWLCPCFKSPNEDNGYDVSDYKDIMDEFGTMDDMDELIGELHSRGMKLILDLVPNHTSTEHRWFQESRKGGNNPYSGYYYWYDEIPNDWESAFKGSAWKYDEQRGQYYLHTFAEGQADLNWDNPEVVKAMQDVVDFWTNKGVDGFRIDVIDLISKDMTLGMNGFGPRLHEYIHALFGRENVSHLFTVGESQVEDIDEMLRHCAADRNELSTLFLFDHMECGRDAKYRPPAVKDSGRAMRDLRDILIYWQHETAKHDILYSLFTENHDQAPMLSRVGNDRELRYETATDLAAMVYLLKGVPFIYQGQEIGATSAHYDSISCFDDVETLGNYHELMEKEGMNEDDALECANFGSRDNARRPMAWDDSEYGGFSTHEPWIPMHTRCAEINVQADMNSEKSVHGFYKKLFALRKESKAFLRGEFEAVSEPDDDFFVYTRNLDGERWAVICNFASESDISLPFECEMPELTNLGRSRAGGKYMPYECCAAKLKD